jgi:hypothetical protein
MEAAIRFQVPGGEVSGTLRTVRKEPDKMQITTNIKGVETRQVLNGDRAWTVISEGDSIDEVDSLDVAGMRTSYVSDLHHVLLGASGKDAKVAARGKERVSGRDADKVEVVNGSDPWRMLYFDPATHRLLAWDQRERDLRGMVTVRRVLGDYRPLGGLQWPYQEERFAGARPLMKLDFTTIEFNGQVNEKTFQPPTKGGAPWR